MTEHRQNIWGLPGCLLPSNKICDACCNVKGVLDTTSKWKGTYKEPDRNCEFMARLNKNNGRYEGCTIYGFGPQSCNNYHCSRDIPRKKLELIEYGRKEKLVSQEEAQRAVLRITES